MVNKKLPILRKATAVWLVENTSLTFEQIADFCGMHELEIQGIADGDVASGIVGQSPITNGQLTKEMIEACEKDSKKRLELKESTIPEIEEPKKKKKKYTPIARRGDKPDGILYLLKYFPEIMDTEIIKLVGTTKNMIESIRNRTHWNIKEIKPRDPVLLGLCSQSLFNSIIEVVKARKPKEDSVEEKKTKEEN